MSLTLVRMSSGVPLAMSSGKGSSTTWGSVASILMSSAVATGEVDVDGSGLGVESLLVGGGGADGVDTEQPPIRST